MPSSSLLSFAAFRWKEKKNEMSVDVLCAICSWFFFVRCHLYNHKAFYENMAILHQGNGHSITLSLQTLLKTWSVKSDSLPKFSEGSRTLIATWLIKFCCSLSPPFNKLYFYFRFRTATCPLTQWYIWWKLGFMQTIFVLPNHLQSRFFFVFLQGMLAHTNYCAWAATYMYGLDTTSDA